MWAKDFFQNSKPKRIHCCLLASKRASMKSQSKHEIKDNTNSWQNKPSDDICIDCWRYKGILWTSFSHNCIYCYNLDVTIKAWKCVKLNNQRGHPVHCAAMEALSSHELHLTWCKSNALINTNAPVQWESALQWAINQLTDGLPQCPYRNTQGHWAEQDLFLSWNQIKMLLSVSDQ